MVEDTCSIVCKLCTHFKSWIRQYYPTYKYFIDMPKLKKKKSFPPVDHLSVYPLTVGILQYPHTYVSNTVTKSPCIKVSGIIQLLKFSTLFTLFIMKHTSAVTGPLSCMSLQYVLRMKITHTSYFNTLFLLIYRIM